MDEEWSQYAKDRQEKGEQTVKERAKSFNRVIMHQSILIYKRASGLRLWLVTQFKAVKS